MTVFLNFFFNKKTAGEGDKNCDVLMGLRRHSRSRVDLRLKRRALQSF